MRRLSAKRLAGAILLAAALSLAAAERAAAAACTCHAPYVPKRVRSCCYDNGKWRMVWMCTAPRDPHHPGRIVRPLECNGHRF